MGANEMAAGTRDQGNHALQEFSGTMTTCVVSARARCQIFSKHGGNALTKLHMRRPFAPTLSVITALAVLVSAPAHAAAPTAAEMGEMFRALAMAYKVSLNLSTYEDPANRDSIRKALQQLAKNSKALGEHTEAWQSGSAGVRRSLADDARSALQRFEAGQYRASRFSLQLLTENCFACHSSLPAAKRSSLGKAFVEDTAIEGLPPEQQAQLAVATRQFDKALAIYESLFKSPSTTPEKIALRGSFEGYLKISIRVYGDYDRPLRTFESLSQRRDLPRFLAAQLQTWIASLKVLRQRRQTGNDLEWARTLIRKAKVAQSYPGSHEGLVELVAASGALQRYLNSNPEPYKVAEAYYLLGLAEAYISRSHSISETEYFLETSIRMDPEAPSAHRAFAFLEAYTLLGYSGSSDSQLPPEVKAKLDELRALIGQPLR